MAKTEETPPLEVRPLIRGGIACSCIPAAALIVLPFVLLPGSRSIVAAPLMLFGSTIWVIWGAWIVIQLADRLARRGQFLAVPTMILAAVAMPLLWVMITGLATDGLQRTALLWRYADLMAEARADQDAIHVEIGQWHFDDLGAWLVRSRPVKGDPARVAIELDLHGSQPGESLILVPGVRQPIASGAGEALPLEDGWWYVWIDFEAL